mgnify:CR=1 FL=1
MSKKDDDLMFSPPSFSLSQIFLPVTWGVLLGVLVVGFMLFVFLIATSNSESESSPVSKCQDQCLPYAMSHLGTGMQCFCDLTKKTPEGTEGLSDAKGP